MGGAAAGSYGCRSTRPEEPTMSTTDTAASDIAAVRGGFEAFGRGDLAAFADMFHPDATWNHRNPDRLGGIHDGSDGIVAFVTESSQLTAGTLRAVPMAVLADGAGRVAVQTRVSGTRPDGRAFDDLQILLFAVEDGRVRSVDQYIGDPPAVTAFWA
jgi:ketosteroid isomerase-like protein